MTTEKEETKHEILVDLAITCAWNQLVYNLDIDSMINKDSLLKKALKVMDEEEIWTYFLENHNYKNYNMITPCLNDLLKTAASVSMQKSKEERTFYFQLE